MVKIKKLLAFALLVSLMAFLNACGKVLPPITDCEAVGDIKPVCNMKTPEDIAALPEGTALLLAHFGHMGEGTGSISLYDIPTATLTPLYPLAAANDADAPVPDWGDANCTTPPDASFGPHGTHLHQLANGRWRYLVVNHGNREAVEMFELETKAGATKLSWRGCAFAAEDTMMNDVVGRKDGSLVYSRMYHVEDSLAMPKSLFGIATGELWLWRKDKGLQAIAGTAAAQPNGLEISADGKYAFANMYMEGEVWKVDIDKGEVVARADIPNADNSAWGSDGRLLVATHTSGLRQILSCFEDQSAACPGGFKIVAMDPETMEAETVFEHEGAPMGFATVAVPQAGRIYMGSAAGDRFISVPDFSAP